MLLVREVFHCKPGKVRALADKFVAMSRVMEKSGAGRMRVMTDVCADRYWTLVAEFEVESMKAFEEMMSGPGAASADDAKEMERIMKDYHDLVESGRREIYKLEN